MLATTAESHAQETLEGSLSKLRDSIGDVLGQDKVTDIVAQKIFKALLETGRSSFLFNYTGNSSMPPLSRTSYHAAMGRPPVALEDVPLHAPRLGAILDALDFNIARTIVVLGKRKATHGIDRASMTRWGSIGANLPQQAFYWRVAASPAVRSICEVCFNGGHSTALWLVANPTAVVNTFDLFSSGSMDFMIRNLQLLQSLFPGRINAHMGDSAITVPRAQIERPCDLVHIDGRHSYTSTAMDAYNLMAKSHPTAVFLFDDQCDVHDCRGLNAAVAAGPTLATCDLVAGELLAPITSVKSYERQFSLFRRGSRQATDNGRVGATAQRVHINILPCAKCRINLTEPSRFFQGASGQRVRRSLYQEQVNLRAATCTSQRAYMRPQPESR